MKAQRIDLMGMPLDALTEPEAVAAIVGALDEGQGGAVITPHLAILRRHVHDAEVRTYFENADLILVDGQPLVWASRIAGTPLPERVAGSDLIWCLAAECALRGRGVYLLGGAPGACESAKDRLQSVYPGLHLAGWCSPPFGFDEDPAALAALKEDLRIAQPHVVFVALGFPKQERVIAELREVLPHAWFLGVGVSLSFIAGHVARAPDWAMRYGLEWLHRLFQEPRRLFRRYLVDGLPFAARLFAHAARRRLTRSAPPPLERTFSVPASAAPRVVFGHGRLERARMRDIREFLDVAAAANGNGVVSRATLRP